MTILDSIVTRYIELPTVNGKYNILTPDEVTAFVAYINLDPHALGLFDLANAGEVVVGRNINIAEIRQVTA